jgi:hypothetical protein
MRVHQAGRRIHFSEGGPELAAGADGGLEVQFALPSLDDERKPSVGVGEEWGLDGFELARLNDEGATSAAEDGSALAVDDH